MVRVRRHAIVLVRAGYVREAGMGYKIRVAPEVAEWAARLNASVHSTWRGMPASREASRMLGKIGFWIARPGLDAAYRQHLGELQRARRAVADVATSRKRLELQIAELERQADTGQDATGQLTQLRRRYTRHAGQRRARDGGQPTADG